jgi:hypothetical protein
MTWSEQAGNRKEAPAYLRNVIRIITEAIRATELPMKKDQVDLANKVVFIVDSKILPELPKFP